MHLQIRNLHTIWQMLIPNFKFGYVKLAKILGQVLQRIGSKVILPDDVLIINYVD